MDILKPNSTVKRISKLLRRQSLNRQLLDILFWQEKRNRVSPMGKKTPPAWSNGSKKHISLLGWGVIKPYFVRHIYKQSPNQETLPCHSNGRHLISQLHSAERLQYGFLFIFLQFNPKYCDPCQFSLKERETQETLSEFSMHEIREHTKTPSERKNGPDLDQKSLKFGLNISIFCERAFIF